MKEQECKLGLMIMTRDDYQYFFGDVRVQPRAIIPAFGDPIFICFEAQKEKSRSGQPWEMEKSKSLPMSGSK